jgi:hyaluronate lyase
LLKREAAGIEAACAALTPVFEYVTEGDGFYEDGSFIQHKRFAYTGGYGKSLLKEVADMAFLLHGTAWALPSGQIHTALDWVERSFAPFMFEGRLMDLVRGREISRFFLDDERAGRQVVAAALRLSEVAPTDRADDLKRMTKSWIAGEAGRRFVDEAPMDIAAMAAKLLRDERTDPRGLAPSLRIFPMMDRAVARWPGYAISISMFSRRTGSYESINEENVRGWYTAHGMTYVYDDDADRYADGFWPTVNAYRLPGTTVSAQPRSEGFGLSRASAGDFVGGAASGDGFGAVGMELEETGEFRAKKSWFFFDDKVVALGTVWPDAEQIRVETIMDNRMLNAIGDNRLTVETEGRAASFVDVGVPVVLETRWIHLAGNVPGADIGYAFPQPATLRILREERSGSWREIDAKGPDEALRRHYITTWFEHDAYPARSEYAYVLLPGRTVEQTADYAASPSVEIMSHSPEVHAIAEPAKGRFAAHFWENARRAVGPIFCDGRATILLQEDDDRVDLWVADPTQANSGRITIELSIPVREVMVRNDRIVVDRLHPTVSLSVRTEGAGGGTLHIAFRK